MSLHFKLKPKRFSCRILVAGVMGASLALGLASPVAAQTFPDKPVSLIVPFAAGGPTDAVARLIAIPMGKALGQTVLVENAVGAGGTIGATKVARAVPNGYTIFLHHMGMSTAPALYKKLQFDPLKDFEYIGQVVDVPMTLLARKDFPANNFGEFLTYVKANKDCAGCCSRLPLQRISLPCLSPGPVRP
jgi:tripartite-type tricarboxylate transporter receptor subunit TctC